MTKKNFSDMVLYKLASGIPDAGFPVDERDIWDSLDHKVNFLFKLKHLQITLPSGETMPEAAMIATYTGNTVSSDGNGRSMATLPVTPITLPKNAGIVLIYDPKRPDQPFIPLQRTMVSYLNADSLLNSLGGQIGFEPKNNVIFFTKDLTQFGITSVTMELAIFDISKYGINDELPIPSDYIDQLEDEIIAEFAPLVPESGLVNNYTNAGQLPPGNGEKGK